MAVPCDTRLCSVALDREIASENARDLARKWTEMSRHGMRSAIRTALSRLRLVTHTTTTTTAATPAEHGAAEIALASVIVDFAFSQCGEFLAVADAAGVLHLFKSETARELFAYPIMEPNAAASDSIQAVVFAARAASMKKEEPNAEIPEDLMVLTGAGMLLRLGNLRLAEIERTLAREASHNVALRAIMGSMQLQQANVGRLRDGARSVLLARQYPSSLFVTVANHNDALSVWRVDTSGRKKEASSIQRHAAYSNLEDGTNVADAQYALRDRCLAVLSVGGSLTWWDWRGLVLLHQMASGSISAFTTLESHAIDNAIIEEPTCMVALMGPARSESGRTQIQVVQVQHHSTSRASDIVFTLDLPTKPTTPVVSMTAYDLATGELRLLITHVGEDAVEISTLGLHGQDDGADEMEAAEADPHAISVGVRCRQELYALEITSLQDTRTVVEFEEKVKTWIGGIGYELEDSRIIVESLVEFSKRLRRAQTSSSNYLPRGLDEYLPKWLDQIASISYRWTTFTLLLSTIITSDTNSQSLASRWREFCNANLLDVMRAYLRRGMMRPVSLLWQRHSHQDALQNIDSILDSLPQDLPFSTYEKWLHGDVVPGIVKHVERQTNFPSSRAADVISNFASWTVKRIQYFAEQGDVDTALKLCHLLKPNNENPRFGSSTDMSLQWVSLRLLAPSTDSSLQDAIGENPLESIDRLSQQLEHMKYLEMQHGFKISLAVFTQETPVTIAMSMLDRATSAEMVPTEMKQHFVSYLRHCGQAQDAVLVEYINEALESAPTTTNPSEQARLIAIIDEIIDVELRASAAKLFFGSLLPPFSSHVKQFTRRCTKWDTRQIDVIQVHVRLMEIQDVLTSYGVARFQVGDARGGSRLVSHILAQIARESAFTDALQLVSAYSHLSEERAALEYFENMLTLESSTMGVSVERVASRRSGLIKSAVKQFKSRCVSAGTAWRVVSVLEETVALGLNLLEMKEAEEEEKAPRHAQSSSSITLSNDFFLRVLEESFTVFLSEIDGIETPTTDEKWGSGDAVNDDLLSPKLLSDIQRIRRMHAEWGILVSVKTVRNPDRISDRVRAFIQPDAMFSGVKTNPTGTKSLHSSLPAGKGKKRALGSANTNDAGGAAKRAKSAGASGIPLQESDEQQDDRQTKLAFDVHRYAAHMGMGGDDYHSLVAQAAAEHGDIIRAVQYSRDLFSRRRGVTGNPKDDHRNSNGTTCSSGIALKNISLSISKYTAMHTEEIYNLATHGHGNDRRTLTPIQLARMQAPIYSLELLRYAICFCDTASFEETLLLLKNAMLSNDILKFTELSSFCGDNPLDEDKLRIYDRWFREEALCVLPGAQTMNLATRFAIAEHRLLVAHSSSIPIGLTDMAVSITSQDFLASKRLVSFLVENNADLLSLQVILAMHWIPEDAVSVVQTQASKLISTVFQSRNIDSFLALGLMLTMEQRDAFSAFRRQISRENVTKDFNRFQRIAKIGSDSARAWKQVAFLNQCVELEGNARWWHFLSLLEIECDQKAFQGEHRDLNYIRSLVPKLLAKSSFDYYTIQEFTRHYQIEDSFPALVYVEALLTVPEATAKSLEYRDKIVGVLEDIHQQQLVKLLLKTLPKVPGTDYDRLLFMFQLLLEHTSYADKDEVERRIEVLHVLKAYTSSDRRLPTCADTSTTNDDNTRDSAASVETLDAKSSGRSVCFHRIMTKPRDVLSEILTTRSFAILSNLDYPLRLESDELLMLLLKNVINKHQRTEANTLTAASTVGRSSRFSGSELERLFGILASLKAVESKITAGEWLAEHLPVPTHKLRSLEFALEAAATSSSDVATQRRQVSGNLTFLGAEALTRLEEKVLRTKIQLVLAESNIELFADPERETSLLKVITKEPKEIFYEVYRFADASMASGADKYAGHDGFSLHKVADRVASVLNLRANELRTDLIRELLVRDAVYGTQQKNQNGSQKPSVGDSSEAIFSPLEQEQRDARDEQLIGKISFIAVYIAQESQKSTDTTDAVALVEYLVTFARDTKPRAGVTFRAKLRAARAVLHLAQSHRSVVVAAVEAKMKLAAFDTVIKELVDHIRHCQHIIIFEENRVPYEIGFVMRAKKETLVRSLLRQQSGREAWVLRCVANLMLDFDVQASDLWEFVLTAMKQHKMFRSLSRVLNGLGQHDFVRSINGASECWEAALLSPLLYIKALGPDLSGDVMEVDDSGSSTTPASEFHGISLDSIRSELELMVGMLQKCPFLEQIDVASFVVHLRDIQISHANSALSREVDLFAYAVRCAMVIPRPSARMQALQRIIQSGAYMQVLAQVCDASVLSDEAEADSSERLFSDHVSEQLAILEAIFHEVLKRDDHEQLLGSPFEHGFLEFLALTGTIDRALAIMLTEKRLEAASTLVELYYESNPERAPPGWSITESHHGDVNGNRWGTLQQYVAASTSAHLATYRQMTA